ncbi:hypothetical protein CFOL_v3_27366 [Cephalotus follicularis]|uniref:Uncharacterized protein n=1 Tax=Cephalotus follicularis TaxID=3775 RepID=A0A1Q3CUW3_CEPFO|nr:hypothetical protein CFOL_v3_27366 [Cephalotus follicularis]
MRIIHSLYKSKKYRLESIGLKSSSKAYGQHPFISMRSGSAAPSSQTQLIGNPGYDPNRIPTSVFGGKPTTSSMEWSVTSNESLFSIHVGNCSFSRDHVQTKFGEAMIIPTSLPPAIEAGNLSRKSTGSSSEESEITEEPAEGFRNTSRRS